MKNRIIGALVGMSLLGFSGCGKETPSYSAGSGSLGLSRDDAFLYAADSDTDQLLVIDAKTDQLAAKVQVGSSPEKVLVGPDDTIYVTNLSSRSVSVVHRGEWKEASRIAVGVEPKGLALSIDGKTLLVVSSTALDRPDVGTLTAIDTKTLGTEWEIPVGSEPRSVAVIGHRAYVSLGKAGELVQVDLDQHAVVQAETGVMAQLNRPPSNTNSGGPAQDPGAPTSATANVRPRGFDALAVTPDGTQVLATGVLASDTVLNSGISTGTKCTGDQCFPVDPPQPGGGGSSDGYGGGSCGATAVASPALLTFSNDGAPLVDDHFTCGQQSGGSDHPATVISSGRADLPIQGPVAAVVDPTGSFVFVANRESDNVAVMPLVRGNSSNTSGSGGSSTGGAPPPQKDSIGGSTAGVRTTVMVGSGPTGIAVAHDGKRAWTYNLFDHSITRLESRNGELRGVATTRMLDDVLPADVAAGRRLFFTAIDARMNNPATGISCNSCHPDAREDGHVWNFTAGPRQTPSLAGRMLLKTAPFHWGGEFASLTDFMSHTVQRRMGGTGVSPAMEAQLKAFISQVKLPDNPLRGEQLTAAQARGAEVFTRAQCHTCHAGEALTDNSNRDVGTLAKNDQLPQGLNTPSLLGLARSAPYLHDGSAASLKARLLQGKDANRHGTTSILSDGDVDDLVAYLQSK